MNKSTVFLIIFCILLAGGLFYFSKNIDFSRKKIEYSNLSISAELKGQKIKTGYIIETSQGRIVGNTSQTYEKQTIQRNQIIKVYNKNLDNQNFYTNYQEINLTEGVKRITLKLEEPTEIIVKINDTNPIQVNLKSENARNVDFCLKSSVAYIFVKNSQYEEKKIENYTDWKCYDSKLKLVNSNETINISYTKFQTPNKNDFIKLILLNQDVESKNPQIVNIK